MFVFFKFVDNISKDALTMDTEISIFSIKCYHFVCMSMGNALSINANNKNDFIFKIAVANLL